MEFDVNTLQKMQGVIDQALTKIETYGYTCIAVGADEDTPSFTYSVGMQKTYGEPDIVIVGLEPRLAMSLIEEFAAKLKKGDRFGHKMQKVSQIIQTFDVQLKPVPRYLAPKVGKISAQLAPNPASHKMNQMILPDKNGLFYSDMGVDFVFAAAQDIHRLDTVEAS